MKIVYLALVLFIISCTTKPQDRRFNKLIKQQQFSVVMFIAPDCPLCKTLAKPYNELAKKYTDIQFLAVHSGENYEAMELNMFVTENDFKPPVFRDLDYTTAHLLNATVTPEFVLVDSSGKILYQGLLDDRILRLGSYKQQWSEFYLEDAIKAVLTDVKPKIAKTTPVGCVLEY